MTGVGGGSLMTPLLVLAFGFHPATAVGTDLLYASGTKTVGTLVHGWRGTVDWRVVGWLAAGSLPAAGLTLLWLQQIGEQSPGATKVITVVLGVTLVLTAIATFLRARLLALLTPRTGAVEGGRRAAITVAVGAVLGVLVSLTSVGAGALGMTALLVLYPRHPINRLVGSDIAHAVPLPLFAGLGHMALGSVDFQLLASLLVGSVPGIVIGSLLATRAGDGVLRPILAGVLAIVGVRLLV